MKIFGNKLWINPLVGGSIVVLVTYVLGSDIFLGLGLKVIEGSFQEPLPWWYFLNKLAFTVVTLGSGFQGGEATPLFFIGSTLGNSLSHIFPLPFSLLAGMGFVGVFSGVFKAPIACSILAIELFGVTFATYLVLACFVSAYMARTFESFSRLNGQS